MNKKLVLTTAAVLTATVTFARPPHGGPMGGGPRPGPAPAFHNRGPMPGPGPHHGGSFWGRGGRNFWGGVVGGIVGSAAYNAMVTPRTYYYNTGYSRPAPVVVTPPPVYTVPAPVPAPVVYTQPVTVPTTTYVTTQPVTTTSNVYRRWVPGRYEYQTVNGVTTRIFIPGHYESVAY